MDVSIGSSDAWGIQDKRKRPQVMLEEIYIGY